MSTPISNSPVHGSQEKVSHNSIIPEAHWLGTVSYAAAYQIQRTIHGQRIAEDMPNTLLFLEHPLVFTIPRRSIGENIRVPREFLEMKGAEVVQTDRGGEVTLHNPGQLVGYLIYTLEPGKRDLHAHIRSIETALQRVASAFGVETELRPGLTGVWLGNRKLASIGIAVKRWVTLHGFALNVNNDLEPFNWINPCGLRDIEMTSLARERGEPVPWRELLEVTRECFGAVWRNDFNLPGNLGRIETTD